jgi:hypothetical protein
MLRGAKSIFASATTHGRNRKNVEEIITNTSRLLEAHGAEWIRDVEGHTELDSPSQDGSPHPAPRLARLADLYQKALISEEEYRERREIILRDLQ